ncbi:MAG: hypothetical protein HY815_15220 [Candidatus Riflebacteria bacterium]|nr:hypothetical protein [Candidatus Riflebacteria bacterium]
MNPSPCRPGQPGRAALAALLVGLATAVWLPTDATARPPAKKNPMVVSMRAGESTETAAPRVNRSKRRPGAERTNRRLFDQSQGNNYEAATQSTNCRGFLNTYLPDEISFGDVRFYLKLIANEEAELALEDGADLKTYRQTVEIAYLIVTVDARSWSSSPGRFQRMLGTMFMPLLRSLYPKANLYITVYDGQNAVANANWKIGSRTPSVEVE